MEREREREIEYGCVHECVCMSLGVCMRERYRETERASICLHKYMINDVLNNFRECYGVSCGLTAPTA